jgi:hypothetical protein
LRRKPTNHLKSFKENAKTTLDAWLTAKSSTRNFSRSMSESNKI